MVHDNAYELKFILTKFIKIPFWQKIISVELINIIIIEYCLQKIAGSDQILKISSQIGETIDVSN